MGVTKRKAGYKFDKKRCATCQFHTGGAIESNGKVRISCNYGIITGSSCLKRQNDGSVMDSRGDDYSNCKLYEKGAAVRDWRKLQFRQSESDSTR